MPVLDVRALTPLERYRRAQSVHAARSVPGWPALSCWNDQPCRRHGSLPSLCERCGAAGPHLCPLCERCGVSLRGYQQVGSMWLYFAMKGLLADSVGLGKTAQVAGVIALGKEVGELGISNRVVVICKPAAIGQWARELARMIPSLRIITAPGSDTRQKRIAAYSTSWEVAVLSDRTLAPARGQKRSRAGDLDLLRQFRIGLVVCDDVDPLRTRRTRSSKAVKILAAAAPRVIVVHGTPLQKRAVELYSFLEPVGGPAVLGTEYQFRQRYVTVSTSYWWETEDQTGQKVRKERVRDSGVKNEQELQRLIAPLILRRQAADVDDVSLPAVIPDVVWLDPSPGQARRYEELRAGVLRKISEEGEAITRPQAVAHFMHGWQICSGLATLDEGRDDSVKLDWAMSQLTGDLAGEKCVVFVNFKPNVAALSRRLAAAGIGHVLMWGRETQQEERDARLDRFRHDPSCRVLVGTTTIEQSLNLQVARHLIAVDCIPNPARMTQLMGRIRRVGSPFQTVYLHLLLLRGTQEESILASLYSEQQTADLVWNERGELFQDRSPLEIMQMIAARRAA